MNSFKQLPILITISQVVRQRGYAGKLFFGNFTKQKSIKNILITKLNERLERFFCEF